MVRGWERPADGRGTLAVPVDVRLAVVDGVGEEDLEARSLSLAVPGEVSLAVVEGVLLGVAVDVVEDEAPTLRDAVAVDERLLVEEGVELAEREAPLLQLAEPVHVSLAVVDGVGDDD